MIYQVSRLLLCQNKHCSVLSDAKCADINYWQIHNPLESFNCNINVIKIIWMVGNGLFQFLLACLLTSFLTYLYSQTPGGKGFPPSRTLLPIDWTLYDSMLTLKVSMSGVKLCHLFISSSNPHLLLMGWQFLHLFPWTWLRLWCCVSHIRWMFSWDTFMSSEGFSDWRYLWFSLFFFSIWIVCTHF